MIAEEAIRYLEHQARRCRERDAAEALCLLLPSIRARLGLPAMDDIEAWNFFMDMREELREQPTTQEANCLAR